MKILAVFSILVFSLASSTNSKSASTNFKTVIKSTQRFTEDYSPETSSSSGRAVPVAAFRSTPFPRSLVPATDNGPNDTRTGYVYYYVPQKHQESKEITLKSALKVAGTVVGIVVGIAVLGFIVYIGVQIYAIWAVYSAFGKRSLPDFSVDKILNNFFNSPNQSEALDFLSTRIGQTLTNYKRALEDDGCLEMLACQTEERIKNLGKFLSNIFISWIESLVPKNILYKLSAMEDESRNSSDCSRHKCKPLFGPN